MRGISTVRLFRSSSTTKAVWGARVKHLIRLEDVHKTYHLGEVDVPVLRGITTFIDAGEMVSLVGASGSGQTTLMNILGCLDRPSLGKYWLDDEEVGSYSQDQRALVRN